MTTLLRFLCLAWLAASAAASTTALIGESEKVYTLAPENTSIRGVACNAVSPEAPRLFVLDQSGKVFVYRLEQDFAKGTGELRLLDRLDLPAGSDGAPAAGPRGLAFALEDAGTVLYFLNWSASKGAVTSQLWRWCIDDGSSSVHDLSLYPFRIGEREVFDLACDDRTIRVCFDASVYGDRNLRVTRGIIQIERSRAGDEKLEFAKHLPDSGESPSRGLAAMELEGARYLWATKGSEHIYVAEAATGRGLFYFTRPRSTKRKNSCWGLCFGHDALWVPESVKGPDRLHRVNVTCNLDARREGPRIFRRLIMTIDTEPETGAKDPGKAYHYYSRPYAYEQLGNQGVWPETECVVDLSKKANATISGFAYDRQLYDANPGNLKIELSEPPYDKSQIIACSGTSVMMAGAMRYLGIPARWLGTGTENRAASWDTNGNGILDADETASCSNGHRYTQVWLGDHYGWTCFDATPSTPDFKDYDPPPPMRSQWRYMSRAAAGHMKDLRIVFNVGSGLFRPLYRDFEYDEKLAEDHNCGGDQRYNLQGRFEKPEMWKAARQRIKVKNVCFVKEVTVSGPKPKTLVTWKLEGDWHKDPEARLSLYLQRIDSDTGKTKNLAEVAGALPCAAGEATVDLSAYRGKGFRLILRKEGDFETGGQSGTFDLE